MLSFAAYRIGEWLWLLEELESFQQLGKAAFIYVRVYEVAVGHSYQAQQPRR